MREGLRSNPAARPARGAALMVPAWRRTSAVPAPGGPPLRTIVMIATDTPYYSAGNRSRSWNANERGGAFQ